MIVQEGDVAEVGRIEAVGERVSAVRVLEMDMEEFDAGEETDECMDKSVWIFSTRDQG